MWVKILSARLEPSQIGLLIRLNNNEKYKFPRALIASLRKLREAGLVEHDADTMENSEYVWLTALGEEFADHLKSSHDNTTLPNKANPVDAPKARAAD